MYSTVFQSKVLALQKEKPETFFTLVHLKPSCFCIGANLLTLFKFFKCKLFHTLQEITTNHKSMITNLRSVGDAKED